MTDATVNIPLWAFVGAMIVFFGPFAIFVGRAILEGFRKRPFG